MYADIKNAVYRCEQIRRIEKHAINELNIPEQELMQRAGKAAFDCIQRYYPEAGSIQLFTGGGNNGGDAYVLANLLKAAGKSVKILATKSPDQLPPAAKQAAEAAEAAGLTLDFDPTLVDKDCDLIVDGLLGIGLTGAVRGLTKDIIQQINASQKPIFALDLPSGLNADTGQVYNHCVRAERTLTFIVKKAGMVTLDGPDYCGVIDCVDLGLKQSIQEIRPFAYQINQDNIGLPLPVRRKNVHKGDFGRVLVLGGGMGMPGAAILAARAALRTGAGAVMVATEAAHLAGMLPVCPEAMIHGVEDEKALRPLLDSATVLLIGPGLGLTDWGRAMFSAAMQTGLPMVVDASALRMLADEKIENKNWVLTPHPGEAAALLTKKPDEIQADRYQAVVAIQQQYHGVCVLKGVGSLIKTDDSSLYVSGTGNPGMASAGMGDILSGIIAALIAQGFALGKAAKTAVCLHGYAGDIIEKRMGCRGFLASDLLDEIPRLMNGTVHE